MVKPTATGEWHSLGIQTVGESSIAVEPEVIAITNDEDTVLVQRFFVGPEAYAVKFEVKATTAGDPAGTLLKAYYSRF